MNFPVVELRDMVQITSGFAFKSELFNDKGAGLPLVRIRDVVPGKSNTFYSGKYRDEFIVNDGDVLIGMDGEFNLAKWQGGKSLLNQRVCKVQSVSKSLHQDYLVRFLPAVLKSIEDRTPFVTVKHLSVKDLKEIRVPLPPLEEQRRIALILDKADTLRAKRRAAIAKLDELLRSVFIEMFGDPVTNPKGWPIRKIADLLDSVKYGSSDKATQEGEIPILRMNNLTYSGQIDLSDLKYITAEQANEKYLVEPGDILFNRTNSKELVGKTAVYDGPIPMAYAGYLVRGRVNQSNAPEYISAFLNSIWGKAILRNMCKNIVGMANINAREFGSIELPVPPSELQRKFQQYVRAVRAQKQGMQEGMKKLDELFASLQQRAFSGKL